MKKILLITVIIFAFTSCKTRTKINNNKVFKTAKYAGTYAYKTKNKSNTEVTGFGRIKIFAESDNSILLHIIISKGAPSYNSGELYTRIKIKNGKGIYRSSQWKYDDDIAGCKWSISIENDTVTVKSIDSEFNCGFGHNVNADGSYIRSNNKIPDFFVDRHSTKVYFSKTKPEDYEK